MAHRILSIVGSRPEIIQAGPLSLAWGNRVEEILVHTGQHYDPSMSELQIADMRLPLPDYNLGVGSLPVRESVAVAEQRIAAVIDIEAPDAVLVRGGANAAIAGARAAAAASLPLVRIEAGVRSYRDEMPEERNRVEIDSMADLLFAPTAAARQTLLREGVPGEVHVSGDVLVDAFVAARSRLRDPCADGDYVLATIHRNYNTDTPERLGVLLACLGDVGCRVVFPAHPRTLDRFQAWNVPIPANVEIRDPVSHSEMLALERDAIAIATDSIGVQREAYLWGVPCVTLREETEWAETVTNGWNALVGADLRKLRNGLARPRPKARPPVFGDGRAAQRIADLTSAALDQSLEASAA